MLRSDWSSRTPDGFAVLPVPSIVSTFHEACGTNPVASSLAAPAWMVAKVPAAVPVLVRVNAPAATPGVDWMNVTTAPLLVGEVVEAIP